MLYFFFWKRHLLIFSRYHKMKSWKKKSKHFFIFYNSKLNTFMLLYIKIKILTYVVQKKILRISSQKKKEKKVLINNKHLINK